MNKDFMLNNYHQLNKANLYIIGFSYGTSIYMITLNKIPRYLAKREKSGYKKYALRLRLNKEDKEKLLRKGCYYICKTSDLIADNYNKGEMFEKIVTEYYGIKWEKDYIPFYKKGDITVNGQEVQIKFQNATITTENQLNKILMKK